MKNILLIVCRFVYRVSGLRAFVSMIESKVLHYRLCIRMVPFSYKLFVWSLGVVTGASGLYLFPVLREALVGENVIVYQVQAENVPQVKNEPVPAIVEDWKEEGRDLVYVIFTLESSRGKNNYSKCEAVGKFNRYGFGIPGDGSFLCFDEGMDTVAVAGWVAQKKASGLSDDEILCLYNTGEAVDSCAYSEKAKSIR